MCDTYDPAIVASFQTGAWKNAVQGATYADIASMTTRALRILVHVQPGQNATYCVCMRLIWLAYQHNGWAIDGLPLHATSYRQWVLACGGDLRVYMRQLAMQLFMQVHTAEWNLRNRNLALVNRAAYDRAPSNGQRDAADHVHHVQFGNSVTIDKR